MFDISSVITITGNAINNAIERVVPSTSPPSTIILFDIILLIIIATIFAFIARALKQPLIPAYILTGIIIGPMLGLIRDITIITTLSEIGIAFLLFFAGLEISMRRLRDVGKVSIFGGTIQIFLIFAVSFWIAMLFGIFTRIEALYIGVAIAFSSTMIVIKLLTDKRELDTLHGHIVVGILLVQDFFAIVALMILAQGSFTLSVLAATFLKGALFILIAILLSKTILKTLFRFAARNAELLLVSAITLCFIFVLIAYALDFSIIIGAFVAGLCLANSPFKTEIEGRIRPLRDFFSIIFFVSLGMQLLFSGLNKFVAPFFVFLGIAIILKPLIIMFLVSVFGYKKRTSFLTGLSLAQLSEFSLIILATGFLLGHLSQGLFSIIVLVTIITMTLTTYLIEYNRSIYRNFVYPTHFLEHLPEQKEKQELEYETRKKKKIILFGCHRMGTIFLRAFEKEKDNLFVVDMNPNIIKSLMKQKISCIYGDMTNPELLEKIRWKDAELVVSTIPEKEDNIFLIKHVKRINPDTMVFVEAEHVHEALELYKEGADYVIVPQVVGGEKGLVLLRELTKKKERLFKTREEHKKHLQKLHKFLG